MRNNKQEHPYKMTDEDFPLRHIYSEKMIRTGERRQCSYPRSRIPQTKVKEASVESYAIKAFGLRSA